MADDGDALNPEPEPEPPSGGGWYSLLAARQAARAETEAAEPPLACPHDGTRLLPGPDGGLYCPFDGWRPMGLPPTGPAPWPPGGV